MSSIKISANTAEFKKSILELSKVMKSGLGKTSVSLFDKNTTKLLQGEAVKQLARTTSQMQRLKTVAGEYTKAIKEAAKGSQEELQAKTKLLRVTQMMIDKQKQAGALQGAVGSLGKGGGAGGLADILGGAGGGGMMVGALGKMLGPLAAAMSIGAIAKFGMGRMQAGYQRYQEGIPSRIALMGRGIRQTEASPGLAGGFARVGMNNQDLRTAQLQSLDAFGRSGSGQSAILQRAQFSRNFGIDLQQLQGYGGSMRAQVGTRGATRDVMKLQASLIASGIEDAVGPYLDTANSLLENIRQDGLANADDVLGVLSGIVRRTGMAPERAAGQLMGLQRAVQGSSGDANAFLQSAFGRAGIGGGTIGGIQEAIRSGGVFGVNLKDYGGLTNQDRGMFGRMGLGTGFKERAGGILDQADQLFSGNSDSSQLAKLRFLQPILGTKNAVETRELENQIRAAIKSGDPAKIRSVEKKVAMQSGTPEERMLKNLEDINKSQEGSLQELGKLRENQEEYLGKQVAPAMIIVEKTLLRIDDVIGRLYTGLANILPGLETQDEALEKSLTGRAALTGGQVSQLSEQGMPALLSAKDKLSAAKMTTEERISNYQEKVSSPRITPTDKTLYADMLKRQMAAHENQTKAMQELNNQIAEMNKYAKATARNTQEGATTSRRPAEIPAKGGKIIP